MRLKSYVFWYDIIRNYYISQLKDGICKQEFSVRIELTDFHYTSTKEALSRMSKIDSEKFIKGLEKQSGS